SVAESLRASGYRPVRFRPYTCATAVSAVAGDTAVAPNKEVLVAAVWTRDGQDWHLVQGLSAEELRRQDAGKRKQAFQPVDVAGYLLGGKEQYAALWLKGASDAPETQLEVGLTAKLVQTKGAALRQEGYRLATFYSVVATPKAESRFGAIWTKVPGPNVPPYATFGGPELTYSGDNHLGICKSMCGSARLSHPLTPGSVSPNNSRRQRRPCKARRTMPTRGWRERWLGSIWGRRSKPS